MEKLVAWDKHQEKIAIKTLKMESVMINVMGGPSKKEAIDFLKRIGYSNTKIKLLSWEHNTE